jgi:hypothetical protein
MIRPSPGVALRQASCCKVEGSAPQKVWALFFLEMNRFLKLGLGATPLASIQAAGGIDLTASLAVVPKTGNLHRIGPAETGLAAKRPTGGRNNCDFSARELARIRRCKVSIDKLVQAAGVLPRVEWRAHEGFARCNQTDWFCHPGNLDSQG